MRTWVLEAPGTFTPQEVPHPRPGPGEVLVRVAYCGVCVSEVGMWQGHGRAHLPARIGHEVSGVVEELGEGVRQPAPGTRVAAYTQGKGFSEWVVVPAHWAIPVPDHVPLEQALGEPMACTVNAAQRSGVKLGDTVVILGAGFMGLLMLQAVQLRGAARVGVVEVRAELEPLARQLGATWFWSGQEDVVAQLTEANGGALADVVIEATGRPEPLALAGHLCRTRGCLVVFGYHQDGLRSVDMGLWNYKGLDVINGHERDPEVYVAGMRRALTLQAAGKLRTDLFSPTGSPRTTSNKRLPRPATSRPGLSRQPSSSIPYPETHPRSRTVLARKAR